LVKKILGILYMIALVGVSTWAQHPAAQPPAHESGDGVPRITVQELKAKIDKKEKVTVVDVRANVATMIKGAIHIPLNDFEKRLNELPKDHLIVTVCS
jgi:hypothetical protein